MTRRRDGQGAGGDGTGGDGAGPTPDRREPACSASDCAAAADFWLYPGDGDGWLPVCERHARTRHPSLEVKAWLESGYLAPVELGEPDGPPAEPTTPRGRAFRTIVDEATE